LTLSCEAMRSAQQWDPIALYVSSVGKAAVVTAPPAEAPAEDARALSASDLDGRVAEYVAEHGPASERQVRKEVRGRAQSVSEALRRLEGTGRVRKTDAGGEACPEAPDTPGTRLNGASAGGVSPGDRSHVVGGSLGHAPAPGHGKRVRGAGHGHRERAA